MTSPRHLQGQKPTLNELILPDLEGPVLDYVSDENFKSEKYTPTSVGPTFFENRLPVITLLLHAVRGEYNEVNGMLKKNPLLLLEKDTVTDYSGRTHYKRTVYQLALGALDQDMLDIKGKKVVDGMKEMIESHFSNLPMKPEEITRIMQDQYDEQFPKGHEIKERKRFEHESKALHAVLHVIREEKDDACKTTSDLIDKIHKIIREENSPHAEELKRLSEAVMKARFDTNFESAFNELKIYLINNKFKEKTFNFTVLEAIYRFRFQLASKTTFESGKHFNHQLLNEAAKLYDANYEAFGGHYNDPKNKLCWRKVFGWVQRLVPACDAQIIAQGPWLILEDGEKSLRSLKYNWCQLKYFPLDSADCEIGVNHGKPACRPPCGCDEHFAAAHAEAGFQNLCRAKMQPHPMRERCSSNPRAAGTRVT